MHRGLEFVCIYLAEMQNVSFTICLLKNKVKGVMELRILGTHEHRRDMSLQQDSHEGTADLQLPTRKKFRPASLTGIRQIFPNFSAHIEVFSPQVFPLTALKAPQNDREKLQFCSLLPCDFSFLFLADLFWLGRFFFPHSFERWYFFLKDHESKGSNPCLVFVFSFVCWMHSLARVPELWLASKLAVTIVSTDL